MIAKIGRSANLYGALAYNQLKVENENGQILFANKMIETQAVNIPCCTISPIFCSLSVSQPQYRETYVAYFAQS
jgi:hypothetical protein